MIGCREVLGCVVLCGCGLAAGSFAGKRFGWVGFALGFPVGFVGAFLAIYGGISAYLRLDQAGPRLPPCHTGVCRGGLRPSDDGDYELLMVDHDIVHRCKCGRDYAMRGGGRRFLERLPDGTLRPYMRHRPFRGWFPDGEGDG